MPLTVNKYENMEQELSLKTIILHAKEYVYEIKRYWYIILIAIVPILCWQGYQYFKTPITFPAKLTFMLNDEGGSQLGGVSAILGSFGLGDEEGRNYDRILELSKSMQIISNVLLTQIEINGNKDLLANHLIRTQNIHKESWNIPDRYGKTPLKDFYFTSSKLDSFNRLERSAIKALYGEVIGSEKKSGIYDTFLNEDTGIMELSANTRSEEFSITFLDVLFEELSEYYIDKVTEKNRVTYEIIKFKVDSIQSALSGVELRSADFEDKNNLLTLNRDKLPQVRQARNKQILMVMYGEALKNLEIADFALKNRIPFIQAIDKPFAPLSASVPSKIKVIVSSILLGSILGILFILSRKVFKDAMNS